MGAWDLMHTNGIFITNDFVATNTCVIILVLVYIARSHVYLFIQLICIKSHVPISSTEINNLLTIFRHMGIVARNRSSDMLAADPERFVRGSPTYL